MPKLNIFVIFHKKIFSSMYRKLKRYRKDVVFIGVKRRISKVFQYIHRYSIIYEQDFKNYRPELQKRGYNETSALYHVYVNKLYTGFDYIGFAQYDMEIGDEVFKVMYANINNRPERKFIFYAYKLLIKHQNGLVTSWIPFDFIINSYNKHFQVNFTADELAGNKIVSENLIICSTFIIPTWMFEKIMDWISVLIDQIYPWANLSPYPLHNQQMGNVLERAYGLALAIELLNQGTEMIQVEIKDQGLCNFNFFYRVRKRIKFFIAKE